MPTRMQLHIVPAVLGGAIVTATAAMNAFAGDDHGYRTGTFVASSRNECRGVPDCASTTLAPVTVQAGGRDTRRFACPADRPNLWGWDAAQHEHILVGLIAVDRWTVTIEGVNAANAPGDFTISLGCSSQPYTGTSILQSRQLAPTSRLPARMPSPASAKAAASGRASAAAKSPPALKDTGVCGGVPFCQEQQQPAVVLGGWDTQGQRFTCQKPYLYAWPPFTWAQTGDPSVSAIGATFEAYPSDQDVLMTNWNPFQPDTVYVTIACSQSSPWTGSTCGAAQADPGCPVVSGSSKTYCSRGPVPVCFGVYQERCAPRNQLYSCTDLEGLLVYCQPCPG